MKVYVGWLSQANAFPTALKRLAGDGEAPATDTILCVEPLMFLGNFSQTINSQYMCLTEWTYSLTFPHLAQ